MIINKDGKDIELTPEEEAQLVSQMAIKSPLTTAAIVAEAQRQLDGFARTRGYDGIMSACTYVSSTVPQFAAEGTYCVELRDQTWAKLYEMLAEVQAGTRPIPTGYADIAGELPVSSAAWPA